MEAKKNFPTPFTGAPVAIMSEINSLPGGEKLSESIQRLQTDMEEMLKIMEALTAAKASLEVQITSLQSEVMNHQVQATILNAKNYSLLVQNEDLKSRTYPINI